MTVVDLLMSTLSFEDGVAHIDVLNKRCRELFDADPNTMVVRVYKDGTHLENRNVLGVIYRPGHAGYYSECGEVIWKYLRNRNEYVVADEPSGDGVRIP